MTDEPTEPQRDEAQQPQTDLQAIAYWKSRAERAEAERDALREEMNATVRRWHLLIQDVWAYTDPEVAGEAMVARVEEALSSCVPKCGTCEESDVLRERVRTP